MKIFLAVLLLATLPIFAQDDLGTMEYRNTYFGEPFVPFTNYCTPYGQGAGYNFTNGLNTNNTAFGFMSGSNESSAFNESSFGFESLYSDTTGEYNAAFGAVAEYKNTTGQFNTADGADALYNNTSGNNNLAIGSFALYSLTSGSWNTEVGTSAGYDVTGTNNVGLGYGAGSYVTTGNNNIHIGNAAYPGDNNLIRIGSNQTQAYIAGQINGNGGGLTNLPFLTNQSFYQMDVVKSYHASGSMVQTTGSISSNSQTLTVASTNTFSVGQGIWIASAGLVFPTPSTTQSNLVATIASFTGATIINLSGPICSNTVSGARVQHDDSAAINAALADAYSYGGGVVYLPGRNTNGGDGYYRVNGYLTTGGNSVLAPPLNTNYPATNLFFGVSPEIYLKGEARGGLTNRPYGGTILDGFDIVFSGTMPSLLSAGTNVFVTNYQTQFNSVYMVVDDVGVYVNTNGVTGLNLRNFQQAKVGDDVSVFAMGTNGAWPLSVNTNSFGIYGPAFFSLIVNSVGSAYVGGFGTALHGGDGLEIRAPFFLNCGVGLGLGNANYPITGSFVYYAVQNPVQTDTNGALSPVFCAIDLNISGESTHQGTLWATTNFFSDPTNVCYGRISALEFSDSTGAFVTPASIGGANVESFIPNTKTTFNALMVLSVLSNNVFISDSATNCFLTNCGFYNTNLSTSAYPPFQVGDFVIQPYALNNEFIAENAYFNGVNWSRQATGFAEGFEFYNGQFLGLGAPSGSGNFSMGYDFKFDYNGNVAMGGSNISFTPGNFSGATEVIGPTGSTNNVWIGGNGAGLTNLGLNNINTNGAATGSQLTFVGYGNVAWNVDSSTTIGTTTAYTNYVVNQIYTNLTGAGEGIHATAYYTPGTIAGGVAGIQLLYSNAGFGGWSNADITASGTLALSLAMPTTNGLNATIITNGVFVFTNVTTSGSAGLIAGAGTITIFGNAAAGGYAALAAASQNFTGSNTFQNGYYNGNGGGLSNIPNSSISVSKITNVVMMADSLTTNLNQWQPQGQLGVFGITNSMLEVGGCNSTGNTYLVNTNCMTIAENGTFSFNFSILAVPTQNTVPSIGVGWRSGFPAQSDQNIWATILLPTIGTASGYSGEVWWFAGTSNSISQIWYPANGDSTMSNNFIINQWYGVSLVQRHRLISSISISNFTTGQVVTERFVNPMDGTYSAIATGGLSGFFGMPAFMAYSNCSVAITNAKYTVDSFTPCDYVMVGASVAEGFGVTNHFNCFLSMLQHEHHDLICGETMGGGNSTNFSDYRVIRELTNAYHPRKGYVGDWGIGNDAYQNLLLPLTFTDVTNIVTQLSSTGASVLSMSAVPGPVNLGTNMWTNNYMLFTNYPSSYIDIYTPLLGLGTTLANPYFYNNQTGSGNGQHPSEISGSPVLFYILDDRLYGLSQQ